MKKIFSLLVIVCILAGCVGAPVITSAQSTNLALASAGAVVTASGSTGVRDVSHINDGDNIEAVSYTHLFLYDEDDAAFSLHSMSSAFEDKLNGIWNGVALGGETVTRCV